METKTFTRQQLYEQVWQRPLVALFGNSGTRELGISDVGLGKACRRLVDCTSCSRSISREGLDARTRATVRTQAARANRISDERIKPIEVIGTPSTSPQGGYVYVLKSAYGYKVGRSRNAPARMRTFGVQLPCLYAVELWAWFDDHISDEADYHRLFESKLINGEWFDLASSDIDPIRARTFASGC